ncbi:MAG: CHAT domain-containing protein [Proteobacteria bacterium]|nr:CHAT domain-containing protein [Pseudomonadota bacterium]
MAAIKVTDSLSNTPEQIVAAAQAIGRSRYRRAVFDAVYYHKKRDKSVPEISKTTGLTEKQVLNAGNELRKAGIIEQTKIDGRTAYSQIEFFHHNKKKIIRLVENPAKIKAIATKRNPAIGKGKVFSFTKKSAQANAQKAVPGSRKRVNKKIRIAFLTTNPIEEYSLRTDLEARDVSRAIQRSQNREFVDVHYFPAAQLRDLLDALNNFRPNIIHFSGHGGDEVFLFDNETAADDEGIELDFEKINKVVSATIEPPVLLVFNACNTTDGAEVFLETVSAVVAMSSSISDLAACLFSEQFYSAIAAGQSIGHALKQGKIVLEAANLKDADLPTIISRPEVDADTLTFIA